MPHAEPPPPQNAAVRLHGLDALRGVAALSVVLLHLTAVYQELPGLVSSAYLAVDFFFMLSGLVMARTFEPRMRAGLAPLTFLRMRYLRLWPTMLVGAVLSVPFLWRDSAHWLAFAKSAGPNLLLLPTLGEQEIFPLNIPAWSIFFELVANLAHGLVLWRLDRRALGLICAAFLILLAIAGAHHGNLDMGARGTTILGGLCRVGFAYTAGILIQRTWGDAPALPVPVALALIAMPAFLLGLGITHGDNWREDLLFVALLCPLLIWGGLRMRRAARIAMAAGALSFPLYAVHYPLLLLAHDLALGPVGAFLFAIACAAIVAGAQARFDHIRKARRTLQCAM